MMTTYEIFLFVLIKVNISLMVAALFSFLVAFLLPVLLLSFHFLPSFLQMVPTFPFCLEWISPPWWQLSSHSWLPFCFLSFSSLFISCQVFFYRWCPPLKFSFLFQSGYPLSGGSSLLIPGCLSASCPSLLFSFLAKFFFTDGAHL
jgi:hypothetical protein